MRRIHGDIATHGFNITGTVNDFAVCRPAAVASVPTDCCRPGYHHAGYADGL